MVDTKTEGLADRRGANRSAGLPLLGTLLLAAGVVGISGCEKKDDAGVDKSVNEVHDAEAEARDKIRYEAMEAREKIHAESENAKEEIKESQN